MFDFLGKTVAGVFIFFVIVGFYELNKPLPDENTPIEKPASVKRKEMDLELYPVQFEADYCHKTIPSLQVKMSKKNFLRTIMPGNEIMWDYTIDKMVYFRNETEPCGFCMTLTKDDGKTEKIFIHRGKNKFHSIYINDVRFVNGGDFEVVQKIISDAGKNHLRVELATSYAQFPKPFENKIKDNNSKESWMEAFAIVSGVSKDMAKITKPAVDGMAEAFKEVTK